MTMNTAPSHHHPPDIPVKLEIRGKAREKGKKHNQHRKIPFDEER
jgi:hypothetical protein